MGSWETYVALTFPAQYLLLTVFQYAQLALERALFGLSFPSTVVVDCGRSYRLSSAIIQHLIGLCEDGQASIAYFYFDFRDKKKQNARNLVTSLLIQLSAFSDPCCDILGRVYSAHGNGARQPTDDVLRRCSQPWPNAAFT